MVLARVNPDMFVGRADITERLYLRAVTGAGPNFVRVSGAPGVGTSEVLRQTYDKLFTEQRFVLPFYFSLRAGDRTAAAAASRFAYEFLLQTIAFRRREPRLISSSPDVCELQKLAPLPDSDWVKSLCDACDNNGPLNNERAYVRFALAAPFRAAARARARVCLIIDDLHEAARLEGGADLIDELISSPGMSDCAVILASRRNFQLPVRTAESVEVEALGTDEAARLVEMFAADAGVSIGDEVRDLLANQFEANAAMLRAFIYGVGDRRGSLKSYSEAAREYAIELAGGRIADKCDSIFVNAAQDPMARGSLINALDGLIGPGQPLFSLDSLRERLGVPVEFFEKAVDLLRMDEVISVTGTSARLTAGNVVKDHISLRHNVDSERISLTTAQAALITRFLKRAPEQMARDYRRRAAIGLKGLLMRFDLQSIPLALIDHRTFRERYAGLSDDEIWTRTQTDTDTFSLPQISFASPIADHIERFSDLIEPERAIAGVGFSDRAYRDEDEVVWLAAEIDSKLEADPDLTLQWVELLEGAASELGYGKYRLWLIAPEGFSSGAVEILAERNAIGSSRRQAVMLRKLIEGTAGEPDKELKEYELTVPVGEDSELIAVHALEEIARRYEFPPKAVNQVKTALVEASINAAEHGLSPDRKIYQKIGVYPDKIVITVSNRGLRLIDKLRKQEPAEESTETRRGWGLNLIKTLMDEVRIESVDDGTRIVMTKTMRP